MKGPSIFFGGALASSAHRPRKAAIIWGYLWQANLLNRCHMILRKHPDVAQRELLLSFEDALRLFRQVD